MTEDVPWRDGMQLCIESRERCFDVLVTSDFVLEFKKARELICDDDDTEEDEGDFEPDPNRFAISTRIMKASEEIAHAAFSFNEKHMGQPAVLFAQNTTWTDESFRGLGLASAMYRFAELLTSAVMTNFWGDSEIQTAQAKRMWTNPSRPFGNPRPRNTPDRPARLDQSEQQN